MMTIFRARICKNRKIFSLGVFDTLLDASKAYNAAARELFGAYAALNPEE